MFILGRNIGWGCIYATSWYDLDLKFDLSMVKFSFKNLFRLYLGEPKV